MSLTWGRRLQGVLTMVALSGVTAASLAVGGQTAQAAPSELGYDPLVKGSLWHIAQTVGAHDSYRAGYTGKGIGVALIDTGVTEVPGLDTGNVYHGPDLSFDSQDPELAHLDAYGHGTHMASIIAGRDAVGTPASYTSQSTFNGIAPDANLLSVKVGAHDGAVDVSQVIAAIDWVVEHRNDNGLNIRVLALAYGTDSTQDHRKDPLIFAVEQAWKAGIVVVVAGGNDGSNVLTLANPAQSPYVIAAGAVDTQGTVTAVDDTVPSWATRGTNYRHVDLVAPGVSVLGARVPRATPTAVTPQPGREAVSPAPPAPPRPRPSWPEPRHSCCRQEPRLTPDQVKQQLATTADAFPSTDAKYRGSGLLDVRSAQLKDPTSAKQSTRFFSTGTGSLEAARGSSHVNDGVSELRGEIDIFGRAWNASSWTRSSAGGTAWQGGSVAGLDLERRLVERAQLARRRVGLGHLVGAQLARQRVVRPQLARRLLECTQLARGHLVGTELAARGPGVRRLELSLRGHRGRRGRTRRA